MNQLSKSYEANGQSITLTAQDVVDYICHLQRQRK